MRAEVGRLAPADRDGYDSYMAASEAIFRVGFERCGDQSFHRFADMLRLVPDMLRLSSHRSLHRLVSRHFADPRLRIAFSFHPLLIGGNPFTASSIYGLIAFLERKWGVHFAMGGTGRLVDGMVGLIQGQGGVVRCGAAVRRIDVDRGTATGVTLESGERIPADIVVSNADSAATYKHLIAPQARRRWSDRRLDRARYSMSLFVWYFGTRRRYPDVAHHTLLLGPRYRELLRDIFSRHVLAEDFSLYLHRPTATDPSLAPPGCDAFYVLSPVPHLASGTDWAAKAEAYRAAIAERLESTLLPGLSANIATSRLLTPQDFQDRLSSVRGAAFGLEPVLWQSAWFRPHNKSEDVANLFLVGAGTHPGAGLPGVLSSARILDTVVPDAHVFA
jgi:phytoene desaturase